MTRLSFKRSHRIAIFWAAVAGVIIFAITLAVFDTENKPLHCQSADPQKSAFLVVNEMDTSAKQIKASLMIPELNLSKEELTVQSVTPGLKSDEANYENLLVISSRPTAAKSNSWLALSVPYDSDSFFYPFEKYVLNLHLQLVAVSYDPTTHERLETDMPIKLQVANNIGELILNSCTAHYSFEATVSEPNSFSIVFKRHRFVRATAIILYSVAFVFLGYILRREETSKALSNSLGYIAALWGIRQIITGSVKLFPTIVDFVTLGLYVIVVAIVAYKWLFGSKEDSAEQDGFNGTV